MQIKLSILIASIKERENSFTELVTEIYRQIEEHQLEDKVEVCCLVDNRELTIGDKRNKLLDMAKGEYLVFIDDDDKIMEYYLPVIIQKLEEHNPDCLGYKIKMTTNGENVEYCEHSLRHAKLGWTTNHTGPIKYFRNVTHFNVVKSRLAKIVRFPDLRFGEDKIYSDRITELCKNEYYIDVPYMFEYRYSNSIPHDKKYGFKN